MVTLLFFSHPPSFYIVTREPGGGAHLVLGPSIPLRKPSIQLTATKKEHPLLLVLNAWSSPLLAADESCRTRGRAPGRQGQKHVCMEFVDELRGRKRS